MANGDLAHGSSFHLVYNSTILHEFNQVDSILDMRDGQVSLVRKSL